MEKQVTVIRTIFLVALFTLVGIATCSAQYKVDLTKFSNDVALATGSVVVHKAHDSEHGIDIAYLEPHVWDAKIDMNSISNLVHSFVNLEQVVPWHYTHSSDVGPNYSTIFKFTHGGPPFPDNVFVVMLVLDIEYIVVTTVNLPRGQSL